MEENTKNKKPSRKLKPSKKGKQAPTLSEKEQVVDKLLKAGVSEETTIEDIKSLSEDIKVTLDKRIDYMFSEILFKLWMAGKTKGEIHSMFIGTTRAFSFNQLERAAIDFKWDERKSKILEEIQKENDDEILISRKKQLNIINLAIDANLEVIQREYVDFLANPAEFLAKKDEKIASWLAKSPSGLMELIRAHSFLVHDGVKINASLEVNSSKSLNAESLTSEEADQLFKIMGEAAHRARIAKEKESTPKLPANLVLESK